MSQETTPERVPPIRTSGQYFFKTSNGQQIARQIHSFGDDSLSFGIASVVVRDREYPVSPKPLSIPYPILVAPDTLSTDWFSVDYFEQLRLLTTGNSPSRLKAYLERRSDGAIWDFSCTTGQQMELSEDLIDLYDGSNEEYRVRVCSNDGAPYKSETALTTDKENSSYKRSETMNKSINLGMIESATILTIYPNPAQDQITINIRKNMGRKAVIKILSAFGTEVGKSIVPSGTSWSFGISTLPAGMYSVVAQSEETGVVLGSGKCVIVR